MVKRNPAASLLFYLLSLAMLLAPGDATAVPPQDILIVHSYHQGFLWTDNVMAGILDVLQKETLDAQIHVEYLDAKRYPPETFGPILTETLIRKTSRLKPKVILVSDDAAFDLMLSLRNELFPGVPLIFCGVNNFKDERLAGQLEVTGVVEDFDIKSTLDVILTLHRQTTHLAVISDSTETGIANRERFRQVAPVFADRLKFLELYDLSTEELLGKLAKLPPDTIILNLSFFRDKLGQSYSTQEGNKLIAAHAGRAIYSCWDFFLVGDVVGGYVTSGRQQGEKAASMVAAILKGIRANDIPIIRTSPNAYMFDYNVMERFGIKESALPKGSVVINRQVSMLKQYWSWLLGIALFCGLQTFLILALLTRGKKLHAANAALGESEHFTRSLLDAIPVPVFYKGKDGRYQDFNKAFLNFYGKSKDELIGKSVFDITSPDMAKIYHAKDLELYKKKGIQVYPYKFKTSHGDLRDVIFHKASLTDEHGSVTGLIGAILDVTEQKQVAIALQESEERFLLAMKASNDGLFDWNLESNEIYYSPAWKRMIGYEDHELPNNFSIWENFTDPEDVKKSWEMQQKLISKQIDRFVLEFKMKHKDGHWVDILSRAEAIFSDSGQAVRVVGTHTDITERMQAEKQLRKSEEQFRNLYDEAPLGYFEYDLQGNITRVNHRLLKMLSYTSEEMIGQPCWKFIVDEVAREQIMAKLVGVRPPAGCLERTYRSKDGTTFPVLFEDRLLLDEDGHIKGIRTAVQDITERKKADKEKEKLQAQLNQAHKMEAIGTLAGGIAHDFNNILGAILGYAEMVQEDSPAGSIVRKDIDQVVKASHRAKDLVKQILAFSRQAESDHIPLQPGVIITEALKMLRSSLPSTINIQQDIDPEAGLILADPTHIHQVMVNLCTNAFHAMEETGGTLSISLKKTTLAKKDLASEPLAQPGHYVQLSIGDTGFGIAPEVQEKMFDPFFTTKEVGKGTGMGLAIIHGIAKSSKGFVSYNSQPDEGTVFHVYLPVIQDPAVLEIQPVPFQMTQLGNERILFIDDEEILAEMGQTMLERLGYRVTVRSNSIEALSTFQDEPDQFDLVITDQTMPGMTGSDLARRILQIRPEMPIILCTGYSTIISEEKARNFGIKGFAMKPLAKKYLADLIRKVLDGEKLLK